MKCDSMFILTERQFDSIVVNGIRLLRNKKLSEISDEQHRNIIRTVNRIDVSESEVVKYSTGNYAKLKKLLNQSYLIGMRKIYPEGSPSTGMGMYFYKLNIEYGGSPCLWSMFTIKN